MDPINPVGDSSLDVKVTILIVKTTIISQEVAVITNVYIYIYIYIYIERERER